MLDVEDLYHRYAGVLAVDDVTLTVPPGEIVGLVGRNGAGKTTTMRAIMGLVRPERGRVRWQGHPVEPADRVRFGYLPEERGLYPQMQVLDQVRYFGRLHGLDRAAATDVASQWIARLGLGGRESDRLVALSHGNQQRVQLAVALVHDPPLLVLDEPFAGLDPAAVESVSGVLRDRAAAGTAVLFSSHQLDLVERLCEQVVILERGRVVAAGTLTELRRRFPQRLRVRVAAPPTWACAVAGARVERQGPDGVVFVLAPGTDPQPILRAALEAGPVEHFGFESADLADLYRQLVAS